MSNALDTSAAEQRIAERITPEGARSLSMGRAAGGRSMGPLITNMQEAMEFAKMMAIGGVAVRKHLRGNPGVCLAVTVQALDWGYPPFNVAAKSYVVNDQLAYEAQLLNAVINDRAPFAELPDYKYEGEAGSTRVCTITVKLLNGQVISHSSPQVGKITTKNSPLWKSDEDQQLGYYTIRAMARRNFPHILLGAASVDEIPETDVQEARDITPPRQTTTQKLDQLAGGNSHAAETVDPETGEVTEAAQPSPAHVAQPAPKPRTRKAAEPKTEPQPAATPQQVAQAVAQPLVQQTLEKFPGSQVADVRTIENGPEDHGANEIWGEFSEDEVPDPAAVVAEFQGPVSDEEERIQTRMGELDHVPVGIDKDDLVQCTAYLDGYDSGVKGILEKLIPAHFATTDRKVEGVAWLLGFSASKPEEKRRTPARAAAFVDGMIAALAGKPINSVPEALRPAERKSEFISWWQGHDAVTGDTPELRRARFTPQQK